jgi:hypothetical protein
MAKYKVFHAGPDADASITTAQSRLVLKGNEDNNVVIDGMATHVSGHFAIHSQDVRYSTLWKFSNPLKLMIPSTLATPNPVLEVSMPEMFLEHIASGAAEMMSLMGMMAAAKAGG